MALRKQIIQPNGVPTSYHRIAGVEIVTNEANYIKMASYIDDAGRESERGLSRALSAHEFPIPASPFVATYKIELPYDQFMTVDSAYGALKAMDVFAGAENVPADGAPDQPEE